MTDAGIEVYRFGGYWWVVTVVGCLALGLAHGETWRHWIAKTKVQRGAAAVASRVKDWEAPLHRIQLQLLSSHC